MKRYNNIFFDLDRTLWDFETNTKITFFEIYRKYKLHLYFLDFESFHQSYRLINDELWEMYRKNLISKKELSFRRFYDTLKKVNAGDEETAKNMSEAYIKMSPNKTALFPGAIDVLEYLSASYSLFIITNGFKEVQHKKISNCKLDKYFDKVFTSEEVGCNKPESLFFEKVLSETGSFADNSLVIGDDLVIDIAGAKVLKIDTVWFNPENLKKQHDANYEINSLVELKNFL